jgi:hypothetical protein
MIVVAIALCFVCASRAVECDASGSSCRVSAAERVSGAWNVSLSVGGERVWLSGAHKTRTVVGDVEQNGTVAHSSSSDDEGGVLVLRLLDDVPLPSLQAAHPFVIQVEFENASALAPGAASAVNVTLCAFSNYTAVDKPPDCGRGCSSVCVDPKDCFALSPAAPSPAKQAGGPPDSALQAMLWRCLNTTAAWWAVEPSNKCIDYAKVLPPVLMRNASRICGQFALRLADARLAVFSSAAALDRLLVTVPTPAPTTTDTLIVIVVGLVALVFCVSMMLTALFVVYRRKKSTLKPTHLVKIVSDDGTVLYIDADLHNGSNNASADTHGAAAAAATASHLSAAPATPAVAPPSEASGGSNDKSGSRSRSRSRSRSPSRRRKLSGERPRSHNSTNGSVRPKGPVVDDGWLLPYESLTIKHHLGAGAFGDVSLAEMRDGTLVAVKRLLSPESNVLQTPQQAVEAFFKESLLMQQLPTHRNVIRLIGVCTEPMCIITEYCEGGSLDRWVRKHEPGLKQVLVMSIDVAHGLQHLHQYNIIHRDLAARNLLMTADNVIRVADFGLARDTNKDGYQTRAEQGPLKWMAPESIEKQRYSRASDTWAYGVTVWELLSRSTPWPELSPTQACVAVITKNLRLERPAHCPVEVFEYVQACWRSDPADRITVAELIAGFSERLADLLRGDDEESLVDDGASVASHATVKLSD